MCFGVRVKPMRRGLVGATHLEMHPHVILMIVQSFNGGLKLVYCHLG